MIALLTDNDWDHIENILGSIGGFVLLLLFIYIFFIRD